MIQHRAMTLAEFHSRFTPVPYKSVSDARDAIDLLAWRIVRDLADAGGEHESAPSSLRSIADLMERASRLREEDLRIYSASAQGADRYLTMQKATGRAAMHDDYADTCPWCAT